MDFDLYKFLYNIVTSSKFYVPVITLIVTYIVIKTVSKVVSKIVNGNAKNINDKRKNTLIVLFNNIIKYALSIFAIIIILSCWGINVAGFITGLGVAGVVAGLALQDALKDIIMGCNIIMDNYFVVGDFVKLNEFTGEVIEFGLKNTKIKNLNGVTCVIANREITNIINYSLKEFILPVEIGVAYEEDAAKVKKILEKILDDLYDEKIVKRRGIYLGINEFKDSSVNYIINIECNPKEQFRIKRIINDRIKESFDKNKIKIPYNQVEVHHGQDI